MRLTIVFVSMMALIPLALNPLGASAQEADNGPAAVVGAFHQALASGDKQRTLDLLDPSVVIFESGGAGVETMVLQHSDGAWRIVHIHWSSRARKESH